MVRQLTVRDRLHVYIDSLSDEQADDLLRSLAGSSPQACFWTAQWQEGELESLEDIAAGRTRRVGTAEEARSYLLSDE